jgi:inosine-uridine nucleoside N-ribohydrolase
MKVQSLLLTKENGVVRMSRPLDTLTALLPNGQYVLTVKKKTTPRSRNQNALMWMWFQCISEATGNTKEEVHDAYCYMFLSRPVTFGRRQGSVPCGTSHLTSSEMKDFLDKVQADAAAELGITLPNPDDLYYQEFYEQYHNKV